MGLASVADRVRELDGEIVIKSRKGHGTQVRISLPLRAGSPKKLEPVQAAAGNVA